MFKYNFPLSFPPPPFLFISTLLTVLWPVDGRILEAGLLCTCRRCWNHLADDDMATRAILCYQRYRDDVNSK